MRRAATLLIVLLLAGCARGPGGDALFPLAGGRAWTYRITTTLPDGAERSESLHLVNQGRDDLDGAPAWRRRSDSGQEYWLRSDASGIYRVAARSPLEREPQTDAAPRYVLRQPYAVGTQWEAATTTYVLERRYTGTRELRHAIKPFAMRYRIDAADQAVQTAAGRFEGCLRVAGQAELRLYDDAQRQWRDSPIRTQEWYCPEVGLVKLERSEPSPTQLLAGGQLTMELTAWR